MSAPIQVMEGYQLCPCGTWVIDAVARRTFGMCVPCYQTEIQPRLDGLEVVGRGMRVQVPRGDRTTKRRKRRETERRAARRKLARESRDAARQRVCAMVPDLYDAVLADERSKRGLDPYPLEIAVRGGSPEADLAFAERLLAETKARR